MQREGRSFIQGLADYTPVFLSQVPSLFQNRRVPVDVALIQKSLPDEHEYLSLGISVDIVKAAAESALLVIVQANGHMPRVLGETFMHTREMVILAVLAHKCDNFA